MEYIIANWKSHKTLAESLKWVNDFKISEVNREVILAVPYPFLVPIYQIVKDTGLKLATQDISPFPMGAYTGAVNVKMVEDVVEYALVGHSERRKYFNEDYQEIANKVEQLLDSNITPILCVDEPYVREQMATLRGELLSKIVIAYEPLEAIGTGNPQAVDEVEIVVEKILKVVDRDIPVLYGGSVNEGNAGDYMAIENVSGLLVGGSSLDANKFKKICTA